MLPEPLKSYFDSRFPDFLGIDGGFKTIEPSEKPYAVSLIFRGQLKIFPRFSSLQTWAEGKGLNVKELEPTLHFESRPHERTL